MASQPMKASPGTFLGTSEEKPFPIEVAELEGINWGLLVATLGTPKLELS